MHEVHCMFAIKASLSVGMCACECVCVCVCVCVWTHAWGRSIVRIYLTCGLISCWRLCTRPQGATPRAMTLFWDTEEAAVPWSLTASPIQRPTPSLRPPANIHAPEREKDRERAQYRGRLCVYTTLFTQNTQGAWSWEKTSFLQW